MSLPRKEIMKTLEEIKNNRKLLIGNVSDDGFSGEIHLFRWTGTIICSWGGGWEHVSVSPYKHKLIPTWEEMCEIKDKIFGDDEWVCQFHPPKEQYVSNMDNCLHLWRPIDTEMVTPPSCLVGVRKGQTIADVKKELKELGLV